MCHLLHQEARLVEMTAQLVFREEVTRRQRAGAASTTRRLMTLWDEYASGQRSSTAVLRAGSQLICPRQEPDH